MPSPKPLPEPWQARMDGVWDEVVDFYFYHRYEDADMRDTLVLAEAWAHEALQRVGRTGLSSDLFWSHYSEAKVEGMGPHAALRYAARATPGLK